MSFMDFTLVPGGAFMMCESISEFDSNVPEPLPAAASDASPEEVVKVVAAEAEKTNYIASVLNDLDSVYNQLILPLVNYPLDRTDNEGATETAEMISNTASSMVERINKICLPIRVMQSMTDNASREFIYGPIRDCLGMILKNMDRLKREGYNNHSYTYTSHPAFSYYDCSRLVGMCLNNPDLIKKNIIDLDMISQLTSNDNPMVTLFSTVTDMLNTMFANPERRVRQEQTYTNTENLESIIKYDLSSPYDNRSVAPEDSLNPYCGLSKGLSCMLRKVKQKCYDLQVDMVEQESSMDVHHRAECLHRCAISVLNMFVLSTILLISSAYQIDCIMQRRSGIENWMNNIRHYLSGK